MGPVGNPSDHTQTAFPGPRRRYCRGHRLWRPGAGRAVRHRRHALSAVAAALAGWPQRQIGRHSRPACLQAVDGCRAHRGHRRSRQCAPARCRAAPRRLCRRPQDGRATPSPLPTRIGPVHSATCGRRWACTRYSAITTGGTTTPCSGAAAGPPRPGSRCRTPASPCTRTLASGWRRTATHSGSPASATSGPSLAVVAGRRVGVYQGVDDLAGTLRRSRTTRPSMLHGARARHLPAVPDRVALTRRATRMAARCADRLFADRALALRQPLRLRPRRRGRAPPRRLGRLGC